MCISFILNLSSQLLGLPRATNGSKIYHQMADYNPKYQAIVWEKRLASSLESTGQGTFTTSTLAKNDLSFCTRTLSSEEKYREASIKVTLPSRKRPYFLPLASSRIASGKYHYESY